MSTSKKWHKLKIRKKRRPKVEVVEAGSKEDERYNVEWWSRVLDSWVEARTNLSFEAAAEEVDRLKEVSAFHDVSLRVRQVGTENFIMGEVMTKRG